MMWRARYDIPFARDGSVRFLPWLIALMVYLAALAVAGLLLVDGALANWNRSLSAAMTVELPPAAVGAKHEAGIAPVLTLLRQTPGVVAARLLPRRDVAKLVRPWLGDGAAIGALPLPRLIDVRIDPARRPDRDALRRRLDRLAPGAVLDDARRHFDRFFRFGLSVEFTGIGIVLLIGSAAMLTTIFTTRAGLAVHQDVIEILHILGARDRYIARQFARQALMLALRGGVVGFVLAVATLFGLGHAAATASVLGQGVRLLPAVTLAPWQWASLAALPIAAALIARVTARAVVARALRRMP
ncbi:MAG: cell division protein FtsX [Stellaceae bacterium]